MVHKYINCQVSAYHLLTSSILLTVSSLNIGKVSLMIIEQSLYVWILVTIHNIGIDYTHEPDTHKNTIESGVGVVK